MSPVTPDALHAALETVIDPEIRKPVTELGMVESVSADEFGHVAVTILLTVAACPLKDTLTRDTTAALEKVEGVTGVTVTLGVMSDEQRTELKTKLRGGVAEREVPFAKAGSLTRVYAVASGKGGVGKSSVTANLAAALAEQGLRVGVVDADIYGFSIPRMLGVEGRPTQVDDMILPPLALKIGVVTAGLAVAFLVWTYVLRDDAQHAGWFVVLAVLAAVCLLAGLAATLRQREGWAFIGTAATLALAVAALFTVLFPNVMPSTLDADWSLTTTNAASTSKTLTIMTWVAVIFTPLVLLYQGWSIYVFRRRIGVQHIPT